MRAKEFILEYKSEFSEGDVIPFRRPHPMDTMSNAEKYDDAVKDQKIKQRGYNPLDDDTRSDIGKIPCPYCEDLWCNFDCDEAQAGGFNNSVDEGNSENAGALVNSGRADPNGKKTNTDSKEHRAVRTPTTTYSKDRKKYNNGAKPGANDGFIGG